MSLTVRGEQAVARQLPVEYKRATKKEEGEILDTVTELTGYNRFYAARVLRHRARYVIVGREAVKGAK